MGLIDREYMYRSPEERAAASLEEKKHQERLNEMSTLFAKGNSLTAKEKRRLEEIYELNRQYMTNKDKKISSPYVSPDPEAKSKKHIIIPILVFTFIIFLFIFILVYYPDLLNL